MPKNDTENCLGVLPSLEVLPLFAGPLEEDGTSWDSVFQIKEHSSYGEIARCLLTRKLVAGVIPWEIFVSDVFSLPGERNHWTVLLLMSACPTELILSPALHRAFYPSRSAGRLKLPSRLVVGLQNQNSLTKAQFQHWLSKKEGGRDVEVIYKMLPMSIRIHALEAEAVDATIVPSPWGMYAESAGIGICDRGFSPGKFSQQLALVCREDLFANRQQTASQLTRMMMSSKDVLAHKSGMSKAVSKMTRIGNLALPLDLFEKAAELHGFDSLPSAVAPDVRELTLAFARLSEQGVLPAQVASMEQMARLLVGSHVDPYHFA